MNKSIKEEAQRLTQGIKFNIFIPMLLIFIANALVSSTFVGAIFSMTFTYMADIFIYKFVKTGRRDFSTVYEDYNSIDNFVALLKIGIRVFLYLFAVTLSVVIISFIGLAIGDVAFLVLLIIMSIVGGVTATIIRLMYYYAGYILKDADYRLNSHDVFTICNEMMKGNLMRLFLFQLSFIGHYLLVLVTFGIYSIWFTPYYSVANCLLYRKIKEEYLLTHNDRLANTIRDVEISDDFVTIDTFYLGNNSNNQNNASSNNSTNSDPFGSNDNSSSNDPFSDNYSSNDAFNSNNNSNNSGDPFNDNDPFSN